MEDFDRELEENRPVNEWMRFGLRLGVSAALHPFEYAKVLIQLGYEPIAPRPGTSFFGKPILVLPNIFQYSSYIRKTDGFYGCYRGLAPKLVGSILSMMFSERIADSLGLCAHEPKEIYEKGHANEPRQVENTEDLYMQYKVNLKRDIVISVTGIVIAHPFHVISIRMMAQFVGRESIYQSIIGSISEIHKTEGILGFFAGLVPKLLCDLACLVLTSTTVFIVNKYIIKEPVARQYNAGFTQFAFSSILYPLQVVSTVMSVSGSRLAAGQAPITPAYGSWVDCWNDLQSRNELKRGNSLLWRTATLQRPYKREVTLLPNLSKFQ